MTAIKTFFAVVLVLLGFVALGFYIHGTGFILYKYWAPKMEDARRDVFENTKSYHEGMAQDLEGYYLTYHLSGTQPGQKEAIKNIVRHKLANFPPQAFNRLPAHIKTWVNSFYLGVNQ